MQMTIAAKIVIGISYLIMLYGLLTERKKHNQTKTKLEGQVNKLNHEIEDIDLKLNKLENQVFEHVSTLEEQDMEAFDMPSAQSLVRRVGTRRQIAESVMNN